MDYRSLMKLETIEFCGLTEPDTNFLKMYFARCKVSDLSEDVVVGDKIIKGTYPIDIKVDLPILQLNFDSYIAYSITNESFTSWDDYEVFEGKAFRIYTKSRYLDFIETHTFAHQVCGDVYPPLIHYGIVCLNHIVNIVSTATPNIIEVNKY